MSIRGKVRPTGTYIGLTSGAASAVSQANEGRIRYNTSLSRLEASENTGAYVPIGAGAGASFTVPDIAALSAAPDASLVDGTVASMKSLMCLWQLDKASAAATDGITIVPTASGTGRWYRIPGQCLFWQKQTAWFVSAATGDDENDGNTSLTPLATVAEFFRRHDGVLGAGATVTVTLLDDVVNDDIVIDASASLARGADWLVIQGQRTLLFSGTVTGAQAWNAGASQETQVTCAGIPVSWTASGLVEQLFVLTSGPNAGAAGWIVSDLGAKTCRMVGLWDRNAYTACDPSPGDTFDVYSVTRIRGAICVPMRDGWGNSAFVDCWLDSDASSLNMTLMLNGYINLIHCKWTLEPAGSSMLAPDLSVLGCLIVGAGGSGDLPSDSGFTMVNCTALKDCYFLHGDPTRGFLSFDRLLLQNAQLVGSFTVYGGLAAFDNTVSATLEILGYSFAEIRGTCFGSGNTAASAIKVWSNGTLQVRGTTALAIAGSSASDTDIGGVAKTFADCLAGYVNPTNMAKAVIMA